ncbi:MAG: hypothetical protein OXC30_06895 [Alphaproteobacteria bacterium]|nr:hypothetical protein [Alphaproteobacteria bacterium]
MNSIFYLRQLRILSLLFSFVLRSADAERDVPLMILETSCSPSPVSIEQEQTLPHRFQAFIFLQDFATQCVSLKEWPEEHKVWRLELIEKLGQIKDRLTRVERSYNLPIEQRTEPIEKRLGRTEVQDIIAPAYAQVFESIQSMESVPASLQEYLAVLKQVVANEACLVAYRRFRGREAGEAARLKRIAKRDQQLANSDPIMAIFVQAKARNIRVSAQLMQDLRQMKEQDHQFETNGQKKKCDEACLPVLGPVSVTRYDRLVQEQKQAEQELVRKQAQRDLLVSQVNQDLLVQTDLAGQQVQQAMLVQALTAQQVNQELLVQTDLTVQQVRQAQMVQQALNATKVQQYLTVQQVQQALKDQQVQQALLVQQQQKVMQALQKEPMQKEVKEQQMKMGSQVMMIQHTLMVQNCLTEQKALMAQSTFAEEEEISKYLLVLKEAITQENDSRGNILEYDRGRAMLSQKSKKRARDKSVMPPAGDMTSEAQKQKYDDVLTPGGASGGARQGRKK